MEQGIPAAGKAPPRAVPPHTADAGAGACLRRDGICAERRHSRAAGGWRACLRFVCGAVLVRAGLQAQPPSSQAQPEPAAYTVAFDSRGGSAVEALQNVTQGARIAEPSSPVREGYTFEGWYRERCAHGRSGTLPRTRWSRIPFCMQNGRPCPRRTQLPARLCPRRAWPRAHCCGRACWLRRLRWPRRQPAAAAQGLPGLNRRRQAKKPLQTQRLLLKEKRKGGEKPWTPDFINLTPQNLDGEHLRLHHTQRKGASGRGSGTAVAGGPLEGAAAPSASQNAKATVFIEYAPLETAWTPVLGDSYYYIYCLWVCGESKGKGYGRALNGILSGPRPGKAESPARACRAQQKQKAWLPDQAFAKKFGFRTVDTAPNGYELLALPFDGTKPRFAPHAKKQQIENKELTVFDHMQCPYILQRVERVERVLRGERRAAVPRPGGYAAKGEGAALCFQQLGRILQRKV